MRLMDHMPSRKKCFKIVFQKTARYSFYAMFHLHPPMFKKKDQLLLGFFVSSDCIYNNMDPTRLLHASVFRVISPVLFGGVRMSIQISALLDYYMGLSSAVMSGSKGAHRFFCSFGLKGSVWHAMLERKFWGTANHFDNDFGFVIFVGTFNLLIAPALCDSKSRHRGRITWFRY